MNKRLARTTIRSRRWRLIMAGAAVAAALGIGGLVYAADGTDVIGQLKAPDAVLNEMAALSGSIGTGGAFSQEPNANAVPFLGGAPGSHVSSLFADFGKFPGINDIDAGGDDFVQALDDDVVAAFGAVATSRE